MKVLLRLVLYKYIGLYVLILKINLRYVHQNQYQIHLQKGYYLLNQYQPVLVFRFLIVL